MMQYSEFIHSLEQDECPANIDPCLRALWLEAHGDWDAAHRTVQAVDTAMAARVHAYLHRRNGEDSNARYWHRHAGSEFPATMDSDEERDMLARELTG